MTGVGFVKTLGLEASALFRRLGRDRSGLALIELAYSAPFLITMIMGGAELTNFTTTKMRMSQLALHVADNAARMGVNTPLSLKKVNESDINEVFLGAQLQSGGLDLWKNGRIILSSLQAVANPNTTNKYKIAWQRCKGAKNAASSYGAAGATNLDGMGPTGRQVTAPADGATMFVQISYTYQPLVGTVFIPTGQTEITEIAAMTVRDLTQVYNASGVTASACNVYNAT
jgi:Flp pilus assembly protein TadG